MHAVIDKMCPVLRLFLPQSVVCCPRRMRVDSQVSGTLKSVVGRLQGRAALSASKNYCPAPCVAGTSRPEGLDSMKRQKRLGLGVGCHVTCQISVALDPLD